MSATSKIPSIANVAFLGLLIFLCLYPGVGTAEQIVDTEPHVVLELGTRGVLPCRIQRRGYTVEWKRELSSGTELLVSLDQYFKVGERGGAGYEAGLFNITDDYSLVIKDVKVQDERIYICSFSDYQTGITFRNSTRVSVQGVGTAEQIVDTEPHVVLEVGTRGVLPCRIQRPGRSVEWKRQVSSESGSLVSLNPSSVGKRYGPGYEAGMFNITDDYSLIIKDVKVQDEGIYICVFSDLQTGIIFRNSTRVSVQEEENRMDGNTTVPNTVAGVTRESDLFVFEDYNQRIAIAAILSTVFLVGSVGNTRVITPVLFSRKLRSMTKTNWFVVNLACADLLTCLALPFNIVAMLSREGWPLPGWICAANAAVFMISLGASIMTLTLIAYNRFYLLTRPKAFFQKLYTTKNVCIMVLIAWLYPAILVLVPHFAGLVRLGYSYKYKTCTQDTSSLPSPNWYSFIAGAGVIIPVFIAIAIIYLRIYLSPIEKSEVSKTGGTPSTQPNTFDLAIVVLAFLVSLLPFGVNVLVVGPASDPGIPWTELMLTFNSCVNPFIYDRTMPDFPEKAEGQS